MILQCKRRWTWTRVLRSAAAEKERSSVVELVKAVSQLSESKLNISDVFIFRWTLCFLPFKDLSATFCNCSARLKIHQMRMFKVENIPTPVRSIRRYSEAVVQERGTQVRSTSCQSSLHSIYNKVWCVKAKHCSKKWIKRY